MEIKEAIEVLKHHNVWRKGDDENAIMTNPKKLGIAIDTIISEFENLFISGVVKSLPSKEEIELRAEQALFGFEEKSRKFDDDYYTGYCDGAEWMKTEKTK